MSDGIFITRELLEDCATPEAIIQALLSVASEEGVIVTPMKAVSIWEAFHGSDERGHS